MDLNALTQSEIRNMTLECDKIGGINLSQGISNLKLDVTLSNQANESILNGYNYYTQFDGVDELKKAICAKAQNYNNITCDSSKNIVVSSGATGAFYSSCFALLKPEDEVIVFEPFYGYHVNTLRAVGVRPIFVSLELPTLQINYDEIIKRITKKTKAILICTPANPSGKIFSEQELLKLGEICKTHNLLVFTDEIYEYFLYDGKKHISPASLEIFKDNTITISGFSKTFSITGWRVGYCIVPEEYHEIIGHISDLIYVCSPSPFQYAVAQGINKIGDSFYMNIINNFTKKRNLLSDTLTDIRLTPLIPEGAYYILADVSPVKGDSIKEKAMRILDQTKIACVPGSAFYSSKKGNNIVRFCFAKEDYELEKACENLLKLKI
ncbi:MAG: pyridoxal phosphate-dependent aminotransferase [Flavobacteriaceae bacterium]|nr:pyridoxal phosphate-dependent aminotransferase [Flavobacteriaceae bacterium]